ncbi:phosphoglycolate phosphatase [Parapusillimonas granuli]|uniref:Phosphoglycolate phosphatase n=1 Tax=Parapusillimonas granuli TaxID=380911 RepID=A0A853FV80_9BURK|nr:phosphoglycolate phosphatase [Parapusillimonas granuli]MBB5215429.1 phosphoglycolate phosphatase [Parapusillimonas granuli]MEB2400266.1 phosphoglycolate phosphatase [Alcaligenaceae bacterium]NYT49904.1 phosphoglycolate phosphatase [Parapusillimonas granuli]
MRFSAVLLDLDGTLLDTIPDLARASNAMRAELGMPELPVATVATYVGKGTENLVKRLLADNPEGRQPSPEETARALEIFHRHYHEVNGDEASVYPGVVEGLEAFSKAGAALAVVTNKPTQFTLPLLERMGLAGYFSQVVCGDTCARKKPDPMPFLHACELLGADPAASLAIGDSINDALAARAANMTVLALPYGYNEGMDVRNLPVDDIVMSIAEAAQWAAAR